MGKVKRWSKIERVKYGRKIRGGENRERRKM